MATLTVTREVEGEVLSWRFVVPDGQTFTVRCTRRSCVLIDPKGGEVRPLAVERTWDDAGRALR